MCTQLYMVNKLLLVIIMFHTYRYVCVCMLACIVVSYFLQKKGAVIMNQRYFASLVVIKITGGKILEGKCLC